MPEAAGSTSRVITESHLTEACVRLAREARELQLPPDAAEAHDRPDEQGRWPPVLQQPPTALEFSRILARSTPVLMRGCFDDRPGLQAWSSTAYLCQRMGQRKVQVALTPNGRADDAYRLQDGSIVFALPCEEEMTLTELVQAIHEPSPVAYLQSQNSNLTTFDALSPLLADLRSSASGDLDLAFIRDAIGREPEAVNLWIGGDASHTAMHRDHYENAFTVLRGTKTFTLYPPSEAYFLEDGAPLQIHQWQRSASGSKELELKPLVNAPPTPWIMIDPLEPPSSERNKPYERYRHALKPLTARVKEGETLFLPAGWFHAVSQEADDGKGEGEQAGLCVCVNMWYESDAEFTDRWAYTGLIRELGERVRGTFVSDSDEEEGETGNRVQ